LFKSTKNQNIAGSLPIFWKSEKKFGPILWAHRWRSVESTGTGLLYFENILFQVYRRSDRYLPKQAE